MSDPRTELLPCPNPWCDEGELETRRARGRMPASGDGYQIACARCGLAGPTRPDAAAAVASWNTRRTIDAAESADGGWFAGSQPAPEGQPVLALYRAWNRPEGRVMKQVVWWREGDWRIYPSDANRGFVDRWRPLAAAA